MLYHLISSNGNGGDDDNLGIDDRINMEDCFDTPLYGYVANITVVDDVPCTLGVDCVSNNTLVRNTFEDEDGNPETNNLSANANNERLQGGIDQNLLGEGASDLFAIEREGELTLYCSNPSFL